MWFSNLSPSYDYYHHVQDQPKKEKKYMLFLYKRTEENYKKNVHLLLY